MVFSKVLLYLRCVTMLLFDYLKEKTSLIFEVVENKQNNSLFFYGKKDCFEFFQNRQKTMKYNHKFIKVSKQEYNILLNACYKAFNNYQEQAEKNIDILLSAY